MSPRLIKLSLRNLDTLKLTKGSSETTIESILYSTPEIRHENRIALLFDSPTPPSDQLTAPITFFLELKSLVSGSDINQISVSKAVSPGWSVSPNGSGLDMVFNDDTRQLPPLHLEGLIVQAGSDGSQILMVTPPAGIILSPASFSIEEFPSEKNLTNPPKWDIVGDLATVALNSNVPTDLSVLLDFGTESLPAIPDETKISISFDTIVDEETDAHTGLDRADGIEAINVSFGYDDNFASDLDGPQVGLQATVSHKPSPVFQFIANDHVLLPRGVTFVKLKNVHATGSAGISRIYISIENVPGYNKAHFFLSIVKRDLRLLFDAAQGSSVVAQQSDQQRFIVNTTNGAQTLDLGWHPMGAKTGTALDHAHTNETVGISKVVITNLTSANSDSQSRKRPIYRFTPTPKKANDTSDHQEFGPDAGVLLEVTPGTGSDAPQVFPMEVFSNISILPFQKYALSFQPIDLTRASFDHIRKGFETSTKTYLGPMDLSNAKLSGTDLTRFDFAGVTSMSGADLTKTKLRSVDFSTVLLRGADLSEAIIQGSDLRGLTLTNEETEASEQAAHDAKDTKNLTATERTLAERRFNTRFGKNSLAGANISWTNLMNYDFTGFDLRDTKMVGCTTIGMILTDAQMSGMDLTYSNVMAQNFSAYDLTGIVLAHCDLSGTILRNAVLKGADLNGAQMYRVDLRGVQLQGVDLTGAYLSEIKFDHDTFAGAILTNATLTGIDLSDADLSGAKLDGANLENANFSRANLQGADLTGATFAKAIFTGAQITAATWPNADLRGFDLTSVDFSDAKLSGAQFNELVLNKTNFTRADLTKATFDNTHLTSCNLDNADLTQASFSGTISTGTSFVQATLRQTTFTDCSFGNADFSKATGAAIFTACKMPGANLSNTQMKNASFTSCDLTDAHFANSQLVGTEIKNCNLKNASLNAVNISQGSIMASDLRNVKAQHLVLSKGWMNGSCMAGADLRGANFVGSYLLNANFCFANLEGAHLETAQLNESVMRGATLNSAALNNTNLRRVDLVGAKQDWASSGSAYLSGATVNACTDMPVSLDYDTASHFGVIFEELIVDRITSTGEQRGWSADRIQQGSRAAKNWPIKNLNSSKTSSIRGALPAYNLIAASDHTCFKVHTNAAAFDSTTLEIRGRWRADDHGTLRINGHFIASVTPPESYEQWHDFHIPAGNEPYGPGKVSIFSEPETSVAISVDVKNTGGPSNVGVEIAVIGVKPKAPRPKISIIEQLIGSKFNFPLSDRDVSIEFSEKNGSNYISIAKLPFTPFEYNQGTINFNTQNIDELNINLPFTSVHIKNINISSFEVLDKNGWVIGLTANLNLTFYLCEN